MTLGSSAAESLFASVLFLNRWPAGIDRLFPRPWEDVQGRSVNDCNDVDVLIPRWQPSKFNFISLNLGGHDGSWILEHVRADKDEYVDGDSSPMFHSVVITVIIIIVVVVIFIINDGFLWPTSFFSGSKRKSSRLGSRFVCTLLRGETTTTTTPTTDWCVTVVCVCVLFLWQRYACTGVNIDVTAGGRN